MNPSPVNPFSMNPVPRPRRPRRALLVIAALLALAGLDAAVSCGCGMSAPALRAELPPLQVAAEVAQAPQALTRDHFTRDGAGSISEEHLREVLAAPTFLEEGARIGVVPVLYGYAPDRDVPLAGVPGVLSEALADAGLFEVTTEVSTDWPADSGLSGLRELAARYRAEYLLLYRHRFVDESYTNAWALMWTTVIGGFFVPQNTLEVAGIVEATLFDVKSGTLLFTVYERARAFSDETIWQNDRKRAEMKRQLLDQAAGRLAVKVVEKSRRLAAARPAPALVPREAAVAPPSSAPQTLASHQVLPHSIRRATPDAAEGGSGAD